MVSFLIIIDLNNREIFNDSNFKASSSQKLGLQAFNARTNEKGWCVGDKKGPHWIQFDMGKMMKLTKVATQGQNGTDHYVSSYKLSYSNNGESWRVFQEYGKRKVISILLFAFSDINR